MTTPRMGLPKLTIDLDLGDRYTQLCAKNAERAGVSAARLNVARRPVW